MKKIGKIKLVHSGRMCSSAEMDSLHGGTGCNKYNNCGWFSYESCIPASATYGFQSDESGVTCNKGYTYATCGLIISYSSCSGDVTYNS